MHIRRHIRRISAIAFIIGLFLFLYPFKQRNSTTDQKRFIKFVEDSEYHDLEFLRTPDSNFDEYEHLLRDLTAHDKWSLSAFLQKNKDKSNRTIYRSRKKICILSIDTRPLERYSAVQDFRKMQFYSVAAYNSLFYGKNQSLLD